MGSSAGLWYKILSLSPPQHLTGREAVQPEALLPTTKQVTAAQQRHTTRFSPALSAADKHVISSTIKQPGPPLTPAHHCWPQWRTARHFSPQMNFTPIRRPQADLQVDDNSHKVHREVLRATDVLMVVHFHRNRVLIPLQSSSLCTVVHFPWLNLTA